MRFAVLSSGSRANATYLEGDGTAILIDCGLSARRACERLAGLGVDPAALSAVVVTHEHSDHVFGLETLARKLRIPVYVNEGTARNLPRSLPQMKTFETGVSFAVGNLQVTPFAISHDAAEPVAFTIASSGCRFGQATDLGRVTPLVRESLRGCEMLVLESNHDVRMLQECSYPWVLKQRIASSHGHLSNVSCGELLRDLAHPGLRHVVLGHISENSNTPERALETVSALTRDVYSGSLICAGRHQSTSLISAELEPIARVA